MCESTTERGIILQTAMQLMREFTCGASVHPGLLKTALYGDKEGMWIFKDIIQAVFNKLSKHPTSQEVNRTLTTEVLQNMAYTIVYETPTPQDSWAQRTPDYNTLVWKIMDYAETFDKPWNDVFMFTVGWLEQEKLMEGASALSLVESSVFHFLVALRDASAMTLWEFEERCK